MDAAAWVVRWSAEYPNREAEDEMLRPFRGAICFSRTQVEELVDWKFQTDPRRRRRTRTLLAVEDDTRIEDLTRQAFACFNDYVALLACTARRGSGYGERSIDGTKSRPIHCDRQPCTRFLASHGSVTQRRRVRRFRGLGTLP